MEYEFAFNSVASSIDDGGTCRDNHKAVIGGEKPHNSEFRS